MTPLPRPDRGDYDGVYLGAHPWTDLSAMLQSIVDGVKEISGEVLSSNNPRQKTVGFYMETIEGDDFRSWEWEIKTDDLNRCLATDKWKHLDTLFRSHTGQARIAATLSQGKLP